jgi:predicted Fe-Mo cluster-binding NifX family protein
MMKIAVTANGPTLEADIDPRFGRCQYLVLIDPDNMNFEAVENSAGMASGGAGTATAQIIADRGVEAVITGNCGPNAYQVLAAAGIKVITRASGKVSEAVQDFKSGKLRASSQPNVTGHYGMGQAGGGMGGGMRRGRGGR